MPCYHPLVAYRSKAGRDPKSGSWPIVFNPNDGYRDMKVMIPCGSCIGCDLQRARSWTVRILCESQMHDKNAILTLTYDNDSVPGLFMDDHLVGYTLYKKHFQKFIKLLRKNVCKDDLKIKYFHCGEYGENYGRPHYHAVIFGYDFPDKKPLIKRGDYTAYESETVGKIWKKGSHEIGELTVESAAYIARYVLKKQRGENRKNYDDRQEEYITMSNGIGKDWLKKYFSDVYPNDCVRMGKMVIKPPRYYDKKLKEMDELLERRLKYRRQSNVNEEDNTYERLLVKEECQKKKTERYSRQYEEFRDESTDIFCTR